MMTPSIIHIKVCRINCFKMRCLVGQLPASGDNPPFKTKFLLSITCFVKGCLIPGWQRCGISAQLPQGGKVTVAQLTGLCLVQVELSALEYQSVKGRNWVAGNSMTAKYSRLESSFSQWGGYLSLELLPYSMQWMLDVCECLRHHGFAPDSWYFSGFNE